MEKYNSMADLRKNPNCLFGLMSNNLMMLIVVAPQKKTERRFH